MTGQLPKRLFACAIGAAVALAWTGASAQSPFDGVFVSDPAGCQWLQDEGASALFEHDFLAFTLADGIVANEFGCEFVDIKSTSDGAALVITAFCEYPGEPFADLISLREFTETSVTLTSLHQTTEDTARGVQGMPGAQTYTRCTNLKDLPVD